MRAGLWAFALVCLAARAESPQDFRFSIPLTPSGGEGLQRIELPAEVHRGAARADLADLRIFNGRGEPLPFAFAGEPAPAPAASSIAVLPLFPIRGDSPTIPGGVDLRVKQRPDGTIVELRSAAPAPSRSGQVIAWIADATRLRDPVSSLRFTWTAPANGVMTRMRIEAGDDLASWRTVVAGGPLVDLAHEGARVRRDIIELPAVRAKFLRFSWQGPPLALESVAAETVAGSAQRQLRQLSVDGVPGERPGERLFSIEARVPVERLRVLLPEANSVVPVTFESRDDPKSEWRRVASATVYRLRRDGSEVESPPIAIAPQASRFWRVTADQRGGGFGSGTVALEVGWLPRQLVFALRGEGPFELAFGHALAEPGAYPVTTLVPGYKLHDEFSLPAVRLGAVVERPGASAPGLLDRLRSTDGKRLALWVLLLAGVALLAVMAWKLSRQVKAPARGSDPPSGSA
jgi:hypothetical protein